MLWLGWYYVDMAVEQDGKVLWPGLASVGEQAGLAMTLKFFDSNAGMALQYISNNRYSFL